MSRGFVPGIDTTMLRAHSQTANEEVNAKKIKENFASTFDQCEWALSVTKGRQTSKTNFAFVSGFVRCKWIFNICMEIIAEGFVILTISSDPCHHFIAF